jgi:8-oxo-dGTP diphosphatase
MQGDRPKRVDYWAATGTGGTFTANHEVDRLEWLPLAAAEMRLTYDRDVELLHEFAAGPAHTTPYIFLRHASAGDKRNWRDDDALRPLDARGRAEAAVLAELLACFGTARVVGSATARCVETALPYSLRVGVAVRAEPTLTMISRVVAGVPCAAPWDAARREMGGQDGGADSGHAGAAGGSCDHDGGSVGGAARRLLLDLLADESPTVICGHGEMLPKLITLACEQLGTKTPNDPTLPKASFWVLHIAGVEVAALERHRVTNN